jgi:S-adenosylmethionine synthetase
MFDREAGTYIFTSESVSEGHPDKVCDAIADAILDAYLARDRHARVACEVMCKDNLVVLAGEITSEVEVDYASIVRRVVGDIGYTDPGQPFHPDNLLIITRFSRQAREISAGVGRAGDAATMQGAGDQGIMFCYATDETPELMPLPILLAHSLARCLTEKRKTEGVDWLRPDAKTQVSVEYEGNTPIRVTDVLVSTQHAAGVDPEVVRRFVADTVVPEALGRWDHSGLRLSVNPTGSFVQGGPSADAGVTGRKIIVDTYGGMGRHGGGAFSGKDPSKVDRSGAYFCRYVARQIVQQGLARRAEVQVSYAIGVSKPVSVYVNTFGTGDARAAADFVRGIDFAPGAMIERLDLLRPIYSGTTNYGHFGRAGLTWEA